MGKPRALSVVIKTMNRLKHLRFFWELLALQRQFDRDPYSLSSDELALLKHYQVNEAEITNVR